MEKIVFIHTHSIIRIPIKSRYNPNPNKSIPRVSLSISKLSHLFSKKLHLLG